MTACPDTAEIDEVLDRCADAVRARRVREHVAGCETCLAAFGSAFELELWGPLLAPPAAVPVPAAIRRRRSLAPLALAAAALLLVGAAAWHWRLGGAEDSNRRVATRSAPPALRVLDLATSVGTRGPRGSAVTTITRSGDEPLLLRIAERSIDESGCVRRHEKLAPLAAMSTR